MTDTDWKAMAVAANDNCHRLSMARAEAMAHVAAMARAFRSEGERRPKGLLRATAEVLECAEAWLRDPIGMDRIPDPKRLEIHVGLATDNEDDVAISIVPRGTLRDELIEHGAIIGLTPTEARHVAALIKVAAAGADAHRESEPT